MNLREFTETVDLRAKEKTKEDLQMLVHSLARKVLEENREEFLAMIEQAGKTQPSEKESKDTSQRMKALDKAEVKKEYARLKKQFLRIQEKEIIFLAEGYEDYSSGYWDSDWVYEYEDPFGIGKTYEEAVILNKKLRPIYGTVSKPDKTLDIDRANVYTRQIQRDFESQVDSDEKLEQFFHSNARVFGLLHETAYHQFIKMLDFLLNPDKEYQNDTYNYMIKHNLALTYPYLYFLYIFE